MGLRRDEGAPVGKVTVAGIVDNGLRKVQLDLGDPEYSRAVEAHKREQMVCCEGELVREGRSLVLRSPKNFRLESEP